jgi:hypothetical protein
MRGSVLISLFGMSMAMVGSLVACSSDEEKPAASAPTGGEGESCTRRADCSSGFKCFEQVCVRTAAPSTGGTGGTGEAGGPSTGGTGGATGGTGGKGGSTTGGTGGKGGSTTGGTGGTGGTAPGPVLGGEGESCTRAADCEADLGCFNNRCAAAPMGEGGDGNVPVVGGGIGQTCVVSGDCASGLACLPLTTLTGTIGVCSPSDTGVEATGKTCAAECTEPADCCELPTELHTTLTAKSCTELDDIIATNGVDCASPSTTYSPHCFAKSTYCGNCAAKWTCTGGSCLYVPNCEESGLVVNGCPTFSRSGNTLFSTCDTMGSSKCRPAVVDTGCDTPADCDNMAVFDDQTDTCVAGECTCYNTLCYRMCDKDLDCAFGQLCGDDDVCIDATQCDSDETCVRILKDFRATCEMNRCTTPCATDLDCSAMGLIDGNLTAVCEDGACTPIGCNDHSECSNAADVTNMLPVRRMFCATPPAVPGGMPAAHSAITD